MGREQEVSRLNLKDLSQRQVQILGRLSNGLTTREIGLELGVSQFTVNKHIQVAREAVGLTHIDIGATSRLASALVEEGLVEIADVPYKLDLTKKEKAVAALVKSGFINKEIAQALVISIYTADKHVSNLLHKVPAKNRVHLASILTAYEKREIAHNQTK